MAMRVINGNGSLSGGSRLGLPLDTSFLAVKPDDVYPQKVPQIPTTTEESNAARRSYKVIAGMLEGEARRLGNARPADWKERVFEAYRMSSTQYGTLVRDVRGRTGNSDAEYELELQWWGLWAKAHWMDNNAPSLIKQGWDVMVRWFEDFKKGAQEAWQGYSDWVMRNSGPLLRSYHESLVRLSELKADLNQGIASGNYSAGQIANQQAALASAEEGIQTIRNIYSTSSAGGNLDKIATDEYGPYMGGVPVAYILFLTVLVMIGYLIAQLAKLLDRLGKLTDPVKPFVKWVAEHPVEVGVGVAGIAALYFLLPLLFKKPDAENALALEEK